MLLNHDRATIRDKKKENAPFSALALALVEMPRRVNASKLAKALAILLLALPPAHANQHQSKWRDITTDIKKAINAEPSLSPIFINGGPQSIRSKNISGITYKRGIFSYSLGGLTTNRDILVSCTEASFKENDGKTGWWFNMQWIQPEEEGQQGFEWYAYKYLCPGARLPWKHLTTNSKNEDYFVNEAASYSFSSKLYGKIYSWVVAKKNAKEAVGIQWPMSSLDASQMTQLYVSCKTKRLAFYGLLDAAALGDDKIELYEYNPNSIGEEIVRLICG